MLFKDSFSFMSQLSLRFPLRISPNSFANRETIFSEFTKISCNLIVSALTIFAEGFYVMSISDNNEIFFPGVYDQVSEYELVIYNRWGEMIFISKDVNIGWDGYFKDKLAEQ